MDLSEDLKNLLNFETYDEYLDSFVIKDDIYYLQSIKYARLLSGIGFRFKEVLSKKEFQLQRKKVYDKLYPIEKDTGLFSKNKSYEDSVLYELSIREAANRDMILLTIIYIRNHNKKGMEVSGYIDFADSLSRAKRNQPGSLNWELIFEGQAKIWPRIYDMGYFNWRSGQTVRNNTNNFEVITDPNKGLLFKCVHDNEIIYVDPFVKNPGLETSRKDIITDKYDQFILYNHVCYMHVIYKDH